MRLLKLNVRRFRRRGRRGLRNGLRRRCCRPLAHRRQFAQVFLEQKDLLLGFDEIARFESVVRLLDDRNRSLHAPAVDLISFVDAAPVDDRVQPVAQLRGPIGSTGGGWRRLRAGSAGLRRCGARLWKRPDIPVDQLEQPLGLAEIAGLETYPASAQQRARSVRPCRASPCRLCSPCTIRGSL